MSLRSQAYLNATDDTATRLVCIEVNTFYVAEAQKPARRKVLEMPLKCSEVEQRRSDELLMNRVCFVSVAKPEFGYKC